MSFERVETSRGVAFYAAQSLTARHGFFTRRGGVSEGIYASLQAGQGTKADLAERVAQNRVRSLAAIGSPDSVLLTPKQVHSADAIRVETPFDDLGRPALDGLVTTNPALAIGALAADCMPVLLEDAEAGVVGACHAGWRGALGGIVEATIETMEKAGAQARRIVAAIGPCIGPDAYEVGPEYVERFVADAAENARFFSPPAPGRPEDRRRFDLARYLVEGRALGIAITASGLCTYAGEDDFFSHRRAVHRGENDYGRLISLIAPRWD